MKDSSSPVDLIIDEVDVKRKEDGDNPRTILLLEGHTDKHVYRWQVDDSKCHIVVANGKEHLIEAQTLLEERDTKGVVSISDADFQILEGKLLSSPHQLLTDAHDLETMILKTHALEKVLDELGSEKKIGSLEEQSKKSIRTVLLECASPIGYLRWLSIRESWNLKFEGLDFTKFVDKDTLKIDSYQLIKTVLSRTMSTDGTPGLKLKESDISDQLRQLKNARHDPWHICCGHDLVTILALGLRKALGTSKVTEAELLEKCLHLAHERIFFAQTQLYAAICAWEEENNPFFILRKN